MKRGEIWIGTSGWVYKEWAGHFYPKGWPKKNEFGYYVQHFPTVEINATFYRLPSLKMVRGWHDKSPNGFLFAVKGSRYLTHIRRLKDTSAGLQKYFRRLVPLAERTGPILWQLPPSFPKSDETFARLERFLKKLPSKYRHAVEFRHPSWMDEQTFDLLRRYRAATVWISSLRMPADYTITSDFVYLRYHGLQGGAYHDYTDDELKPWAKELVKAAHRGIPSFVYFNNDLNTRAPLNAHALMRLVENYAVEAKARTSDTKMPEIAPPKPGPEIWRPWTPRSKEKAPTSTGRSTTIPRSSRYGRAKALATAEVGTGAPARPPSVSARRRAR